MEQAKRSRTTEIPAIMRALHQTLDDNPKILDDPVSSRLIDPGDDRSWLASLLNHPDAKQSRAGFALRGRYAEDCLAEAVQRGARQYMILGAGLDTFAYRQPAWGHTLEIYEIDHPATQQWKRERLKAAGIAVPTNLRFVPIDFERTSIGESLRAVDFAFGVPTFCSWMGVTQYLTRDAIDTTFKFILTLVPGSEIVFSIILPHDAVSGPEAERMEIAVRRAAEVGEPWLTRLRADELASRLKSMGFTLIVPLSPEQARERYFSNRRDGLRERRGEQLIRAIV